MQERVHGFLQCRDLFGGDGGVAEDNYTSAPRINFDRFEGRTEIAGGKIDPRDVLLFDLFWLFPTLDSNAFWRKS